MRKLSLFGVSAPGMGFDSVALFGSVFFFVLDILILTIDFHGIDFKASKCKAFRVSPEGLTC